MLKTEKATMQTIDKFSKFGYNYSEFRARGLSMVKLTSFSHRLLSATAAIALLIALPSVANAQVNVYSGTTSGSTSGTSSVSTSAASDPSTVIKDPSKLRGVSSNAPTLNSTTGAPTNAYKSGVTGCNSTVQQSFSNTANYHYVQQYSNYLATVQQPQSFSSCIQKIMANMSQYNMFSAKSFKSLNFSSLLKTFGTKLMTNLEDQLESQTCAAVNQAAQGIFGSLQRDVNGLLNGTPVISLQAGIPGLGVNLVGPSLGSVLNSATNGTGNGDGTGTGTGDGDDEGPTIACPDGTVGSAAFGCGDDATGTITCPDGSSAPANLGCGTNAITGSGSSNPTTPNIPSELDGSDPGGGSSGAVTGGTVTNPTNPSGCAGPLMSDGTCGDSSDQP